MLAPTGTFMTRGGFTMTATMVEAPRTSEAAEPVPLRRNRNFNLLWGGSVAAELGLSTADIAYPLVILAMIGSPLAAGLFATVQLIASGLATLPVGHMVVRYGRRRRLRRSHTRRTAEVGRAAGD